MSNPSGAGSGERALGLVLLTVGGLILLVKYVPAITISAILHLWPLLLIYLGFRMIRKANGRRDDLPG